MTALSGRRVLGATGSLTWAAVLGLLDTAAAAAPARTNRAAHTRVGTAPPGDGHDDASGPTPPDTGRCPVPCR